MYNTILSTIFSLEHFEDKSSLISGVFVPQIHNPVYLMPDSYSLMSFTAFAIIKSFWIAKYSIQPHESEFLILIIYRCIHKH